MIALNVVNRGSHFLLYQDYCIELSYVINVHFGWTIRIAMIERSQAKSHVTDSTPPSMSCAIEFEEICCICDKDIPNGSIVLRKVETKHIICVLCLLEIAQVK